MKKKILLTLTFIFVLMCSSGCTAEYTLKYENDTFTEYVNIRGESEDDAHPTYNDILENGLYSDINGEEYFELQPESSRYDVVLTHELENVTLKELKAVSECFNLSTYKESDGSYFLALYGGFTCTYLTNSTFTLETDAKVLINNAHEIDDNKYIWNLDEEALGEEGIKFQVMKTTVEKANIKTDTMIPIVAKILILLILVGVSVGLILLLKKSVER